MTLLFAIKIFFILLFVVSVLFWYDDYAWRRTLAVNDLVVFCDGADDDILTGRIHAISKDGKWLELVFNAREDYRGGTIQSYYKWVDKEYVCKP